MKVVAAMSGGVDSSVIAGLLKEQGHDVIGVHMKLHDAPEPDTSGGPVKRCCGLTDALDARRVAESFGIPFYVMDLRTAFRQSVMEPFVNTYVSGATTNPCILCNGVLKFRVLMQRAKALGASHLATGHYAQITRDGLLGPAVDKDKDQSYFLFPIPKDVLKSTLFPLGGLTKTEVRSMAERFSLSVAHKPESQEICFIPDDDHGRFIAEQRPGLEGGGAIVDKDGKVLGQHDGFWRFTPGQRRGLGVSLGRPAYVIKVDPETKAVTLGENSDLIHASVMAEKANWLQDFPAKGHVFARIRHRGRLVPCRVANLSEGRVRVDFMEPVRAAAKGQAVVWYWGASADPTKVESVVGGAWITETLS